MNYLQKLAKHILLAMVVLSVFPTVAYAYLDPGTGSYIFQVVVGSLLGGVVALGMFWQRIKNFFSGIFNREKAGE